MRAPTADERLVLQEVCKLLPKEAADRILSEEITDYTPFIDAYVLIHDRATYPDRLRRELADILIGIVDDETARLLRQLERSSDPRTNHERSVRPAP